MSSISRASASASASAEAGLLATSGWPAPVRRLGRRDPFEDQLRQQHAPLEAAERVRELERFGAVRHVGERQLVLVDVAERHDARQHRGVGLQRFEERLARERAGAPGRQEQRRVGERQRIAGPGNPSTRRPSRSAPISVGRNGAERES